MKNKNFLAALTVAALFSVTVTVAVSCQKQTVSETNDQNLIDVKSKEVTQRVLDFREQMKYYRENPNMKSGGDMPADSALLYIEATLNYTYSFKYSPSLDNFSTKIS
ncbi:MAG: hypothetical protein L3J66_12125 [Bacteroidales bacterium]|nr:hypothetical protein [Bacteroidales bacterium]